MGDTRKSLAAFEDVAKRMLKCVEDSEDFKDSLRELKEQLESLKEADFFMQIAKQVRTERGQKLFQIFRQAEE